MPFHKKCRMTLTNIADEDMTLYYQINYTLTEVPEDAAYFHAQFRRTNPLPYKDVYTILDGVQGQGQFVGTYMAWGVNNTGWWGEGEIKFFLDGDGEFPTICGTGTEDYFCGSYNFDLGKEKGGYREFTTPYAGLPQVIRPDGIYFGPDALRPVPLARHRPCALHVRPARERSRPWAGAPAGATCPCRMISRASRSGIRPCPPRRSRSCRIGII